MRISESKVFVAAQSAKRNYNFIVLSIIAFVMMIVSQLLGEVLGMILGGSMPVYLRTTVFTLILGFGFMVVFVFLHVRYVEKRAVVGMGYHRENAIKKYLVGCIVGIGFMAIVVIGGLVSGAFSITMNTITLGGIGVIIVMFLGFVVQGAAEEVLVRGWMLPLLSNRYNVAAGIILSSVFFAVFHALNPGMTIIPVINLVLVGLFLALYYIKEQSVWGIFGFHTAWNWCQGNVFGIKVSGNNFPGGSIFVTQNVPGYEVLSGGSFGAEGGLLCTAILLAGTVYLLMQLKKEYTFN